MSYCHLHHTGTHTVWTGYMERIIPPCKLSQSVWYKWPPLGLYGEHLLVIIVIPIRHLPHCLPVITVSCITVSLMTKYPLSHDNRLTQACHTDKTR